MVFDRSKQYKKLVHKQGEIRFAKDENHRQDILMNSIREHIKQSIGVSKKTISASSHAFIKWLGVNYSTKPGNGIYSFQFVSNTDVDVFKNSSLVDSINIVPDVKYENVGGLGLDIVFSKVARPGDIETIAVNNAVLYSGGKISYDGANISVNRLACNWDGYDFETSQVFGSSVALSEGQSRYVALEFRFDTIDYSQDNALAHYIEPLEQYHDPAPDAKKLVATFNLYSVIDDVPATSILFGLVGVQDGSPYSVGYLENIVDKIDYRGVLNNFFDPDELRKIKTVVNDMQIDLRDGEGLRWLKTEKVPSMPNLVDTATIISTIQLSRFGLTESIRKKILLRESTKSAITSLKVQIRNLKEFRLIISSEMAMNETSPTPGIKTKASYLYEINAISESLNNDIQAGTISLTSLMDTIGSVDTSGILKDRSDLLSEEEGNIRAIDEFLQRNTKGLERTNDVTSGILNVKWNEPALVDNEDIVGYVVSVVKMSTDWTETEQDCITANLTSPASFLANRENYFYGFVNINPTSKKKTVSNGVPSWETSIENRMINIDVKPDYKLVLFIAPITELGVTGDWSSPKIIDVPNLMVNDMTFEEAIQERIDYLNIRNEINQSMNELGLQETLDEYNLASVDNVGQSTFDKLNSTVSSLQEQVNNLQSTVDGMS